MWRRNANRILGGAYRELFENLGLELTPDLGDRALFARISQEPVLSKELRRGLPAVSIDVEHLLEDIQTIV